MVQVNWNELYYQRIINYSPGGLHIGQQVFGLRDTLEFGPPFGSLQVVEFEQPFFQDVAMGRGRYQPQFVAYVFNLTHQPAALNPYFPLTKTLDKAGLKEFYRLIQHIIRSPGFDLKLLNENLNDLWTRMPAHVVYLVAGHLAEIFFYRRDILERTLSAPCHIWLYTTPQAFANNGGVAGGCFNPERGCLQLVLSRLYEGFNDRTPGVAPFLHEFGHLLDHFDSGTGKIGKSHGLLPGMRLEDREIYTSEAHQLFVKGKRLELERYMTLYEGKYQENDPLPIGHPYVFQNDTEFIAGYFEMFFRNPHYFAEMNPDLYQSFARFIKQDPRVVWEQDFPFYIQQNRDFYLKSGKRPPLPGLT
jgi:hypothetical protein